MLFRSQNQLRIVQGEATDIEALSKTLIIDANHNNGRCTLVSHIVSDIGAAASPQTTELVTRVIVNVLDYIATFHFESFEKYRECAPRLTAISWAGMITNHLDKMKMEDILDAETRKLERNMLCGGLLIVRPSLPTKNYHTPVCGVGEKHAAAGDTCSETRRVSAEDMSQLSHTIWGASVGRWIFEEMARDDGYKWFGLKRHTHVLND